jgi:hypothetical protein
VDKRKSFGRFKPKFNKGDRIIDHSYPDEPDGRLGTIRDFLAMGNNGEEWYSVCWDNGHSGSTKESYFKAYVKEPEPEPVSLFAPLEEVQMKFGTSKAEHEGD